MMLLSQVTEEKFLQRCLGQSTDQQPTWWRLGAAI